LEGDDVTGGWRGLNNEELHNLYALPSINRMMKSRSMRWTEYIPRMGVKRNAYWLSVEKPGGKGLLARPRHRWAGNIKMDVQKIVWINLTQDKDRWKPFVNTVMNFQVP
jgi:hypothetical protein